jgi:hypothetical protein
MRSQLHVIPALAVAMLGRIEPGVAVPLKRRQAQGYRAFGVADDELELMTMSELDTKPLVELADEVKTDPAKVASSGGKEKELQSKGWAAKQDAREGDELAKINPSGSDITPPVALSAHGFQRVAALRDNGQMGSFMRRLIKEGGYNITDEESLKKLIPHFNGRQGNGTYQELLDALSQASRLEALSSKGTLPKLAEEAKSDPAEAANNGLKGNEQRPTGWAVKQGAPEGDKIVKNYASAPPVALSVHGFQRVAALQDNGAMGSFVRRLIEDRGYKIKDEEAFKKFVPHFNGRQGNGTYVELLNALGQASWLEAKLSNGPLAKLSWLEDELLNDAPAKLADEVRGGPTETANNSLKVKEVDSKVWAPKHDVREGDEIVSINERDAKGDPAKVANNGLKVKEVEPKVWAPKYDVREGDEIVSSNERDAKGDPAKVANNSLKAKELQPKGWFAENTVLEGDESVSVNGHTKDVLVKSYPAEAMTYVVGQTVESRSLAGKWWKAMITRVNDDSSYAMVVDDGYDTKWPNQGLSNIRPVQSS